MNMADNHHSYRLARPPGYQGARLSAGDQAEDEKLATGITSKNKRYRTPLEDFLSEQRRYWPKFVLVDGENDDGKFQRLSAIKLSNAISETLGEVEEVSRTKSGSLLLHLSNRDQLSKLENLDELAGVPVKVTPHRNLNSCRGVISSYESHKSKDAELDDWFKSRGIPFFRRLGNRTGDKETLLLTFQGTELPKVVKIGFERCRVRPYIPNPLRCFRCQKFNHLGKDCRGVARCANCGSKDHTSSRDNLCSEAPRCVNCGEDHPSFVRSCPFWAFEKKVKEICVTKKVTPRQARRLAEDLQGLPTYANVTRIGNSPGVSPRSSPRERVQLDHNHTYSKYAKTDSSQQTKSSTGRSSGAQSHEENNPVLDNISTSSLETIQSTPVSQHASGISPDEVLANQTKTGGPPGSPARFPSSGTSSSTSVLTSPRTGDKNQPTSSKVSSIQSGTGDSWRTVTSGKRKKSPKLHSNPRIGEGATSSSSGTPAKKTKGATLSVVAPLRGLASRFSGQKIQQKADAKK